MVSSTLCPAVHISDSQNVYCRAEGIADHYWPWAVFLPDAALCLVLLLGLVSFVRQIQKKECAKANNI